MIFTEWLDIHWLINYILARERERESTPSSIHFYSLTVWDIHACSTRDIEALFKHWIELFSISSLRHTVNCSNRERESGRDEEVVEIFYEINFQTPQKMFHIHTCGSVSPSLSFESIINGKARERERESSYILRDDHAIPRAAPACRHSLTRRDNDNVQWRENWKKSFSVLFSVRALFHRRERSEL